MSYTVNAMSINHVTEVVLVFSTGGHASNLALLRLGSQHVATGPPSSLLSFSSKTYFLPFDVKLRSRKLSS